jgi:molybdopterin molybdotransferase
LKFKASGKTTILRARHSPEALCHLHDRSMTGTMKNFFKVADIEGVCALRTQFPVVAAEAVPLGSADGRVLAETIAADLDIPGFARSTMDGYALQAATTFGASEGNPGYVTVVGAVAMGEQPALRIGPGEAVRIATGGMLPPGGDAVVMIEHTETLDETTIEVYKSVAPGQHVVAKGEDIAVGDKLLVRGQTLRPQEAGLLAALGCATVPVYRQPRIGIISTGDEVVPVSAVPGPGQIRNVNSTTLAAMVRAAGGRPRDYGIISDNADHLKTACTRALAENDMLLVSAAVRWECGILPSRPSRPSRRPPSWCTAYPSARANQRSWPDPVTSPCGASPAM